MVYYDNIPVELRILPQWVCARDDSKIPFIPWEPGNVASSVEPDTWCRFPIAKTAVDFGYYQYCGFVFADNGYVGIDIDDAYDKEGFIKDKAADIIKRCGSYTERSKSGDGFHIIVRGDIPFKGRNNLKGIEMYKTGRYFIMTGITFLYTDIVENQAALDYIVEKYFPSTRESKDNASYSDRVYTPRWEEPVADGRVKLRPVYPRIPEGCRNICLTSLAGMLHNQGYSKSQIYNELSYANAAACDPPLDNRELQTICNSVSRYKR